jgi:nucleobase:cation symporter-1, NCS1 family
MAMIAFWATLSLNMPDFTRFSKGQRQQVWGQILGLPTTMSYIAIVSILVTSAATLVYHQTIWDPVQLTTKFSSTAVVIIGADHGRAGHDVGQRGGQRGLAVV